MLIFVIAEILISIFEVGTSLITQFGHHHRLRHRILHRHSAQDFSLTVHLGCREFAMFTERSATLIKKYCYIDIISLAVHFLPRPPGGTEVCSRQI